MSSREGGVVATGAGASVRLVDATIETTLGTGCGPDASSCVGGIGVGAYVGASVELRRFVVFSDGLTRIHSWARSRTTATCLLLGGGGVASR